tara:strand:+ start:471 stop:785 length:315 start_codon:yes stop_codon:yes gene_type:complete
MRNICKEFVRSMRIMDERDYAQMDGKWEKYYTVKYGGREGRIKAINRESAVAQFEWMIKSADCFCRDCVQTMKKGYSVYMDWTDATCTTQPYQAPQVISGIMQG